MLMRINKYISGSGVTSRRKAEELITTGRVIVNNKIIKELSYRINPDEDQVLIDGEKINVKRNVYFLLNKPKGVISSTDDDRRRKTVIDIINSKERLFPVGRLDYNTTGVLLITNDGNFSNLLTHPSNRVPRIYEVRLDKPLTEHHRNELLEGVFINKRKGKFISINFLKPKEKKFVEVECVEGRNRFVKKMFETLGYNVKSLNRSSFGGMKADIPQGNYRELRKEEVEKLVNLYSK